MSNHDRKLLNTETVLSIPLKKTNPVELYLPLRKLVASAYSESDAEKVESVLETLNKCRRDMVERRGDLSLPMQRDCLIHYFKCLCMVEPLFTSLSADADADSIIFVWYDAFNPEHKDGVSSQRNAIQLEKAAVLFNIGAIHSQIAASCDRTTALGRHLAMDAFRVAANFFDILWKDFAKDVVSATLDLTPLFAQFLHYLFPAQASELELQQQLNNNDASNAFQKHECAGEFVSVYGLYLSACLVISKVSGAAVRKHVYSFDRTWVTHLRQKMKFFQPEVRQRRKSSFLPESEGPDVYSWVTSCAPDHDAECVTEILDGKLVAYPWDMPPPYPTNSAILSSSVSSSPFSHIHALLPLKKSEPLNLYESLRSYFVLKYSESMAKRVEGLVAMDSSQHNIHLEKASVLFNLVALCTHIALSCDLSTNHGHRLAMDALKDALTWIFGLWLNSNNVSATFDLSQQYTSMINNEIDKLKLKFCHPQSDVSSLAGYPASTYDPSSDVTEQFLLGYWKAHSLLGVFCEAPCLDLLSEVSPVKIKDGNLVANATWEAPNLALENMSLQETQH
ncbi:ALG-2 interacting protein X [Arachis hypogaea]|uniref:BRO1 domain-containing protein n=3 Tax=Arachis hypogaea TaxID=3818 RepID=A0A445CKU0_ARAHY|nr:ALG-2 interacting protein X [Arachis hypogaea]RYR51551.1 hypothetical protein Ahy_A06g026559 isoform A [Arachis hypogaea]